jgi:hypothetical protein
MSESITLEKFKNAYIAVQIKDRKKGFKGHLISYVCMNTLLVIVNLLTKPDELWSLGSVIGWGVGVIVHYITQVATAEKSLKKMAEEADSLAKETS